MPWWFYLIAIPATFLVINGIPHFINGISGRRFPSPFSGGPGTEDAPWRNVLWGSANLLIGGILFWVMREHIFANTALQGEVATLAIAFATLLGYAFGNPERFGRRRRK